MDCSNGDLNQFIPKNGGTSKNRQVVSNKKKRNQNETTAVYDDVAVAVDPVPEPANCVKRVLRKRSCKITMIVILMLISLTMATILVLFFVMKQSAVAGNFLQSSFNVSASNSSNSSLNTPLGKGRPYWSLCSRPNEESLAEVHAVYTKDCELTNKRCLVKQNSEGSLEILFTPKRSLQSPIMTTRGCALSTCIERAPTQPNACKDSNLDCPLAANNVYMYRSMEVARVPLPIIFSLDVDSEISMFDTSVTEPDKKQFVFCVVIPVTIVK